MLGRKSFVSDPWRHIVDRDLTWPISVVVSLGFFVYNAIHFTGPAYTGSDEVAYLAKAAFLAGKPVDYASSWFAGYSVFLVPAFAMFSSPKTIWLAVLAINALLWCGSFVLLGRFLRKVGTQNETRATEPTLNFALLASCLYPGWFVLSGYAFPNSAFVFIFMIALATLVTDGLISSRRAIGHFASVVYLCWIHPAGYAVLAVSIAIILANGLRTRSMAKPLLASLAMIMLVFIVGPFIEKSINDAMTPDGFGFPAHYGSHISGQLRDLLSASHLIGLAKQLLTVSSAVIIATFGLVVAFGISVIRVWASAKSTREMRLTQVFILGSLIGVITITSLSLYSPARFTMQVDHWVFLRYAEGVMLPVIALGVLSLLRMNVRERVGTAICSLMILLPAAVLLQHDLGVRGPTSRVDNHFVMSAGFWPYNFDPSINFRDWIGTTPASAMTYQSFIRWYLIGAIGICVVVLGRRFTLALLLPLALFLSPRIQTNWHEWFTKEYSSVPPIRSTIDALRPASSCVVINWSSQDKDLYDERYIKLTFELTGFNLQRSDVLNTDTSCRDPVIIIANETEAPPNSQVSWLDTYGIVTSTAP
jgi:hypothetical protein